MHNVVAKKCHLSKSGEKSQNKVMIRYKKRKNETDSRLIDQKVLFRIEKNGLTRVSINQGVKQMSEIEKVGRANLTLNRKIIEFI